MFAHAGLSVQPACKGVLGDHLRLVLVETYAQTI